MGYALVYYAGMDGETFFSLPGKSLEPSFMEALYLSGVAVSTLGFGDVTPTSTLYQAVVVSDTESGCIVAQRLELSRSLHAFTRFPPTAR